MLKICSSYSNGIRPLNLLDNECLDIIGNNTGNLIFSKYFTNSLKDKFEYVQPHDLNINDSHTIFLLANFLRPTFSQEYSEKLLNFLNSMKNQITVVSIGCQADLENINPKEYVKTLDNTVKQIAYKMSEKSVSIGVRGEFTYNVFKELGIKNVDLIGCPSWFVNGYNQKDVIKKEWDDNFNVAFYSCWEPYSEWHQKWHKKLLDEALKLKDTKFVLQSEFEYLPFYLKSKGYDISDEKYIDSLYKLSQHFGISVDNFMHNTRLSNLLEIFTNVSQWENFTKSRDLNFGFRIHGSIISLKQGIPALPIAPDSRISEFCDLFKIPYIKVNTISSEQFNLRNFYENADFSQMNKVYTKLLENYISFLNKNGISHNFSNKIV